MLTPRENPDLPVIAPVERPDTNDSMFAELLSDDVVVDELVEQRAELTLHQIAEEQMLKWARLDKPRVEEDWPELSDDDLDAVVEISNHAAIQIDTTPWRR